MTTRGDGVRGLKMPCERGTEAGAAAPPAGCAHTNGTRRSRARETPQGPHTACRRRWEIRWLPARARVRPRRAKKSCS